MTVMMIRKTAKDLAGADFEDGPHSDRYRKFWGTVDNYIARTWPKYVEIARTILTAMLTRPDVSQTQKDEIFEALREDHERQIKHRSRAVKVGVGKLNLNPEHPGALERKLFH